MLDRDLAQLYGIETRSLKQAVNRNLRRFPKDFMFILNQEEAELMVSQNVIPSKKYLGGSLPFVFTEQGVANLSSVLNNEKAIEINIQIMRAFVSMRRFLSMNAEIFSRLDKVEKGMLLYDYKFREIFKIIESRDILPCKGIFYDGQVLDAHKFISDLIDIAKESIVLIDNYVDHSVLSLFCSCDADVTIYTRDYSRRLKLDLEKYNSQYKPIRIKEFRQSHDRFLIIDEKDVYQFGASLKDLGKKWFAFSKFDRVALEMLEKLGKKSN